MASLFVIQGSDQGRRYDLDDDAISLGRDNDNSIQLHDNEVSRHHAEVRSDEEGFLLVDLNSSNGSFVNGNQITEQLLVNGDRVQLGRTLMIFTGSDDSSSLSLADEVDIVGQSASAAGSRIIHSMSHEEGSQIIESFNESESPWLARARSNLQIMYRTALAVSHTL
ncbi:MAG TPA: FHA domain-containing protein, partial [Pirellulaceae bacterium]|nr:FHA domain-containing protein [Pirellulaceae bacterium]